MSGGTHGSPTGQDFAPMRTIVFHGTADKTVNPINGDTIARQSRGAGQTIETSKQRVFAGRNANCIQSTDIHGITTLEHWSIDGLGHAWSGGNPGGSYTDPRGPDASAEMVRFFFELPGK